MFNHRPETRAILNQLNQTGAASINLRSESRAVQIGCGSLYFLFANGELALVKKTRQENKSGREMGMGEEPQPTTTTCNQQPVTTRNTTITGTTGCPGCCCYSWRVVQSTVG